MPLQVNDALSYLGVRLHTITRGSTWTKTISRSISLEEESLLKSGNTNNGSLVIRPFNCSISVLVQIDWHREVPGLVNFPSRR